MIPISAFVLFALLALAGSRYEQLQGDLMEEKIRQLTKITIRQGIIINKFETLIKEFNDDDNN